MMNDYIVISIYRFETFDKTCDLVYCPHSRQPNDAISVLAGPLKRRLAALICTVCPKSYHQKGNHKAIFPKTT